jgi:thioredoxin 1
VSATPPARAAGRTRLIAAAVVAAALAGAAAYAWLQAAAPTAAAGVVAAGAAPGAAQPGDDAVQAALARGKPVVAEFGSASCVGCREMKPVLAELQRTHGEKLTVVDIDVLKERQYLARYRIQLMPTQVFFDAQGREIGRHMGTISGAEILARLGEAIR